MSRRLTTLEAEKAFEEMVVGLAKQHLRLRFRKCFGTGEVVDTKMLVKGTATAPLDRPVSNLLQELAPTLIVTRLTGTGEAPAGETLKTPGTVTMGELISAEEVEQALIVQGRRARIYVYFDPSESHVYAAREVTPLADPPTPKPKSRVRPAKTAQRTTGRPRRSGGRR